MISRNIVFFFFLFVFGVGSSFAQEPPPVNRQVPVPQSQAHDPDEANLQESDKILRALFKRSKIEPPSSRISLAMLMGAIAGVESTCSPERARKIRICTEFYFSHWEDLTGLSSGDDSETAILPVAWRASYLSGYNKQLENSPMSCDSLYSLVLKSDLAAHCDF